jgi:fumagillin biosynthesis cytochrome P450 monooxygenase
MNFLLALFLLSLGYLLYQLYFRKSVDLKLPPGPKPWPIIGNIMDLPPKGIPEHQHWLKHKDIYGPVSSVTILRQTMVILHDRDDVHELMEKNSLKTSSRPSFEFASNWCNFRKFTACKPYDDVFRRHRKFMHQQLGTKKSIEQYHTVLEAEAGRFLLRLLEAPQNLTQHLKTYVQSPGVRD